MPTNVVSDELVEIVDVMPTLLEMIGLELPRATKTYP